MSTDAWLFAGRLLFEIGSEAGDGRVVPTGISRAQDLQSARRRNGQAPNPNTLKGALSGAAAFWPGRESGDSKFPPAFERAGHGDFIRVFDIATCGNAGGDARDAHGIGLEQIGQQ
jgi:hypothetical protein